MRPMSTARRASQMIPHHDLGKGLSVVSGKSTFHTQSSIEESQRDVLLLDFEDTVYDYAWAMTLIRMRTERGCCQRCVSLFGILVVLILNCTLQALIIFKAEVLIHQQQKEVDDRLWTSLCAVHTSETNASSPFIASAIPHNKSRTNHKHNEYLPEGHYMNCGSPVPTRLQDVSTLDLDGDGMWYLSEAEEKGSIWKSNAQHPDLINLDKVWHHFMDSVSWGSNMLKTYDIFSKDVQAMEAAKLRESTLDYTAIPMSWMESDQLKIHLCAVVAGTELCGNLEARGILKVKLPHIDESQDRVLACEALVAPGKYCNHILGERYITHVDWTKEICHEPSYYWYEPSEVNTVQFGMAAAYIAGEHAITHNAYQTFLFVILFIWWMLVFKEVRRLWLWWNLIFLTPTNDDIDSCVNVEYKEGTKEANAKDYGITVLEKVEIVAQPRWHKILTGVFVLLPRTVVCFCLGYVGTRFLGEADDYIDLILNSVALGFLIDIDNMLYAAVVGHREKSTLEKVEKIKNPWPYCRIFRTCCDREVRKGISIRIGHTIEFPEIPLLAAVYLVCFLSLFMVYYTPIWGHGKVVKGQAINCLCQAEGDHCITAHILGGYANCADVPIPCNGFDEFAITENALGHGGKGGKR
mmetsp:Transcript_79580/g.138094  ORF Transcript_79580/g.138094 Transcript_79580/m.138094 type:complete len:637 (-) Transcript_79580:202-2112(-)